MGTQKEEPVKHFQLYENLIIFCLSTLYYIVCSVFIVNLSLDKTESSRIVKIVFEMTHNFILSSSSLASSICWFVRSSAIER